MNVSLVIPTRNRARQLAGCLAAVARIHAEGPWELIVVDNGSTDATPAVIADFARTAAFPVVAGYEPDAGSYRARNVGWTAARGELVAFTDDDCYVGADHVDRVASLFRTPGIGYGGGRLTLFDPADFPITIQLQEAPELIPPRSYVPAGFIHGANMVFRRDVLVAIGGFDPIFMSGGDVDAQARASFAGWAGIYDPALSVAHHHRRDAPAARRLARTYAFARGAYFAKSLLSSDTRREFARRIYWQARKAPWTETAREAEGAIGYLCLRAWLQAKALANGVWHGQRTSR